MEAKCALCLPIVMQSRVKDGSLFAFVVTLFPSHTVRVREEKERNRERETKIYTPVTSENNLNQVRKWPQVPQTEPFSLGTSERDYTSLAVSVSFFYCFREANQYCESIEVYTANRSQ